TAHRPVSYLPGVVRDTGSYVGAGARRARARARSPPHCRGRARRRRRAASLMPGSPRQLRGRVSRATERRRYGAASEVAMATSSDQSLDQVRQWLGRETHFEGADEVTRSDIRRKLEVFAFACPLHYDDTVAQAHGYRTVIAPRAMTPLWSL